MKQRTFDTNKSQRMSCKNLTLLLLMIASTGSYPSGNRLNHIDIYAGQRVTIHLVKQDPNLLPPRGPYRETVSPIQLKYGSEHFSIDIKNVIKGDYAPNVLDFYLGRIAANNRQEMQNEMNSRPVIIEYNKIARSFPPDAKGFNIVSTENAQINFHDSKVLTVTYIWLNMKNAESYSLYEKNMQVVADRLDAITQAKFKTKNSDYHAFPDETEIAPDYVIFTEWPSLDSIEDFFNSKEYKEFGRYLESGTKDILILHLDNDSFYSSTESAFRVAPERL